MARPSGENAGQTLAPSSLVRALRHLLRPLVRLLLSHHITYPLLSSLLKSVYVEIAERELSLETERISDSRLSLLTGIHRKDIKRLRGERADAYQPPPSVSLGARLAARWTSEPEFLDESGAPRALACGPAAAGEPTFERLVASVSKDIRPRAVLDEWVRLGVVEIEDGERARLRVEAFVPERGFDEKAHFFGRNIHDHLAAGVHNLTGRGSPMLERSVYYDGLRPESADELAELSERLAMDALKKVNTRAMSLQKSDAGSADARMRMTFGSYFFVVRADEDPGGPREQESEDE